MGALLITSVLFILYRDYSISTFNDEQLESAKIYNDFLNSSSDEKEAKAKQIIDLYSDTLYADFSALHLAKIAVEEKNLEEAKQNLNLVITRSSSSRKSSFNPLKSIAKLRLSRIYLEEGNAEGVLDLLENEETLTASLYEVKGDAESSLNRIGEAKLSYIQALELSNSQPIKSLISMKISDLQENK